MIPWELSSFCFSNKNVLKQKVHVHLSWTKIEKSLTKISIFFREIRFRNWTNLTTLYEGCNFRPVCGETLREWQSLHHGDDWSLSISTLYLPWPMCPFSISLVIFWFDILPEYFINKMITHSVKMQLRKCCVCLLQMMTRLTSQVDSFAIATGESVGPGLQEAQR